MAGQVRVDTAEPAIGSPGFLGPMFRVMAWIAFIVGAAGSGGAFFWILGFNEGFWGFVVATIIGCWFAFWTFFLWGFLLLSAAIADYIGR